MLFDHSTLFFVICISQEDDPSDTWAASQDHLAELTPGEDVDKMDIDSEVFRALPLEIQHELITEMKEKGKKSSWKKLGQLPKVIISRHLSMGRKRAR